MKNTPSLIVIFVFALGCLGSASAVGDGMSPVTRVVNLLKGLAEKIHEDAKAEKELFETYVCWGKNVISSKTAANEKAKSRKDSLEQYVEDLDAGLIELTTERADLEKELKEVTQTIENAEASRAQENEDFVAAQKEMDQAIAALEESISVLGEATAGHKEGLLTVKSVLSSKEGFKARVRAGEKLARAVKLGERYLSESDARFLRRVLTADVPVPDHKRLARKADFKMKYKARSGKIQDLLKRLLGQFQQHLSDAESKEANAKAVHDKLMAAKNEQKDAAEDALSKMEVENGARGLSKTEAEAEVEALQTQIDNDTKYIAQTEASLKEKTDEWDARKALRAGEITAITKAVDILHSDDARDLFKQSYKSQGYEFLQDTVETSLQQRWRASTTLRNLAFVVNDKRLSKLAGLISSKSGGHFDSVIKMIDDMIDLLQKEESEDLGTKEDCEKDRAKDVRQAQLTSVSIDELSDLVAKLEAEIEELVKEQKEKKEAITKIEESLKEAKIIREDETKEWEKSDADDKEAVKLIKQATEVLKTFYQENGLAMLQKKQPRDIVEETQQATVDGQAPPPPPATWEAPYGGKSDENDGIVSILEMLGEDIKNDLDKAKEAEDQAQKEYDEFVTNSEAQIETLKEEITKLEETQAKKEQDVTNAKEEILTKKGEVDAVIKKLKATEVGCDFYASNFAVRTRNRQLEIDGLNNAKAILKGSVFTVGPDANREIKPGDALLLQKTRS